MKRTVAMLIAVLLAMAVAVPVMASPYPDMSDLHWAASAVETLTALGIVQGYPDGTFKGQNSITRYEIAVIVAKLLKYLDGEINARIAGVEKKIPTIPATTPVTATPVPTPAPVTTVVQVEPDQTILETIIREKIEAMTGPKFEDIDERIAELFAMIQDLRTEFSREISILGVRVNALDDQLKQLAARVAKNEADIAALKQQFAPVLDKLAKNEADVTALKQQLAPVLDKTVKNEGDIAALKQQLAPALDRLAKAEADIAALKQQLAPVLDKTVKNEAEISALKQQLAAVLDKVNKNEADVVSLKQQLAPVIEKVSKNEADIAALKLQLSPALDKLAKHDERLAAIEKALAGLGAPTPVAAALSIDPDKLAAAESKLLALESKLNTVDNRVGVLELRASEVDVKVAKLQGDVVAVAKQSGQNASDIIDLYAFGYKNADDINLLRVEMAAKIAAIEEALKSKGEAVTVASGVSPEQFALLKLDVLESQDDITKLKSLYGQVEYLYNCCDAVNAKIAALDEKVAMLNLDLIALESEKVDNALLRISLLEPMVYDLADKYGALAVDVQRNSDDINDLYLQQNHTGNLLKNLAAADAALNERVAKIEAENKIKADELAARVASLESSAKTGAADILSLKSGLSGLGDTLSKLWVNKFLLSGSFYVEFKDQAVVFGTPFNNPFDLTSGAVNKSNKYEAGLSLKGVIKPEPGVEISIGLNAALDTYGIADTASTIYNGDLDITITAPNGAGEIKGGEMARPKYISKYVMSATKFSNAKYEGLQGWMKYTPVYIDKMTLGASAILSKLGSTSAFEYVWGIAGNANYAGIADMTVYYLALDDRLDSGDTTDTPAEKNIGVNLDFKLSKTWSAGAFANVFLKDLALPETAITAYLGGTTGPWHFKLDFERVSELYAPKYAEFTSSTDPDTITADVMTLKMSNSFDVLPNLVFGWDMKLNGPADWNDITLSNEIYTKWSFGKDPFTGALKLYGGREALIVDTGVWNVPVPDADGKCYVGGNLDLKLWIFNAGFGYKGETYDVGGFYAGVLHEYKGYLNTKFDIIANKVLTAEAGWEGVFGNLSTNYQKLYGELVLNTSFFQKWNLSGKLGAYYKSNDMFKAYADAKLTYNITEKASLYAKGGFEYRNYVAVTKPDGIVLTGGVGYTQKIFNATSLVAEYSTKYVKYTFNPGGYADNLVNILSVKLSTAF